jgi:maltose alpha-D-glucosyltransferase/alpha-amylase
VFGGAGFPSVGEDGILTMTWGARDFYWLVLAPPVRAGSATPVGTVEVAGLAETAGSTTTTGQARDV